MKTALKVNEQFMRGIAGAIKEHTAPLHERIKALEARPIPQYRGVYQEGATYCEANVCTYKGGLWIARATTTAKPGTDDTWQLIVKRGEGER